jgi:hypothetical protein
MPLKVDVRINDKLIERIHIGRLNADGGTKPGTVNDYGVIRGAEEIVLANEPPFDRRAFKTEPEWTDWLEPDGQFQHTYDDGTLACVMKALAQLTPELAADVATVVTARLEAENAQLRQQVTELQAAIDAPPF